MSSKENPIHGPAIADWFIYAPKFLKFPETNKDTAIVVVKRPEVSMELVPISDKPIATEKKRKNTDSKETSVVQTTEKIMFNPLACQTEKMVSTTYKKGKDTLVVQETLPFEQLTRLNDLQPGEVPIYKESLLEAVAGMKEKLEAITQSEMQKQRMKEQRDILHIPTEHVKRVQEAIVLTYQMIKSLSQYKEHIIEVYQNISGQFSLCKKYENICDNISQAVKQGYLPEQMVTIGMDEWHIAYQGIITRMGKLKNWILKANDILVRIGQIDKKTCALLEEATLKKIKHEDGKLMEEAEFQSRVDTFMIQFSQNSQGKGTKNNIKILQLFGVITEKVQAFEILSKELDMVHKYNQELKMEKGGLTTPVIINLQVLDSIYQNSAKYLNIK